MNKFLELTLADGRELDVPAGSILMMEEMTAETNPNFPDARSFIHYHLSGEVMTSLLKDTVSDLFFHLDVNVNPATWLKLTRKEDGMRVVLQSQMIISRMALEEGCQLSVLVGNSQKIITVKESRREIKKWSEGSDKPEENDNEVSPPAPASSGKSRPRRV